MYVFKKLTFLYSQAYFSLRDFVDSISSDYFVLEKWHFYDIYSLIESQEFSWEIFGLGKNVYR